MTQDGSGGHRHLTGLSPAQRRAGMAGGDVLLERSCLPAANDTPHAVNVILERSHGQETIPCE